MGLSDSQIGSSQTRKPSLRPLRLKLHWPTPTRVYNGGKLIFITYSTLCNCEAVKPYKTPRLLFSEVHGSTRSSVSVSWAKMPLGERAGDRSESRYCGVETGFSDEMPHVLAFNLSHGGFDFVVAPLVCICLAYTSVMLFLLVAIESSWNVSVNGNEFKKLYLNFFPTAFVLELNYAKICHFLVLLSA